MSDGKVLTIDDVNGRVFVHSNWASLKDYRLLSTLTERNRPKLFLAGCSGKGSLVVEMECRLLADGAEHGFSRLGRR